MFFVNFPPAVPAKCFPAFATLCGGFFMFPFTTSAHHLITVLYFANVTAFHFRRAFVANHLIAIAACVYVVVMMASAKRRSPARFPAALLVHAILELFAEGTE